MTQPTKLAITICTVSFKHRILIEMNIDLAACMNPGHEPKWIVVENTPKDSPERFEIGEKDGLRVIEGIENNFKGLAAPSYHHASGLNLALKEVQTRYALILDPDCFLVRKNWAYEVLTYMQDNDLAFFGIPYNPKRYLKYRYFPCIHGMFIDLDKINREEIDFTPNYKK